MGLGAGRWPHDAADDLRGIHTENARLGRDGRRVPGVTFGCILVFALSTGVLHADQPYPSQQRIDSFYKDLNAAEEESKGAKPASKETIEFLQEYLANPKEFPGPIERSRAALSLFRIDPESKLAQKNLVELMSFIRESDDARPDYLGIFKGLEEMGQRAHPICDAFNIDTLNRWHPDRKRAIKLFHNLCEHKKP